MNFAASSVAGHIRMALPAFPSYHGRASGSMTASGSVPSSEAATSARAFVTLIGISTMRISLSWQELHAGPVTRCSRQASGLLSYIMHELSFKSGQFIFSPVYHCDSAAGE